MQAKTMIQTIAAAVILTAATSWGSMIWNFNDGTSQGWKDQSGGNAEIQNWGGSNAIFTQIQNGSGATGSLSVTGLSQIIGATSNYIQFSTLLNNNGAYPHSSYGITVTTTQGEYYYAMLGENNSSGTFIDLKLNLFTDLTKQGAAPTLAVGDTITSIKFSSYMFSCGMYADNISLVVPEPASLALLALGGCCLLRRRR